MPTCREISLTVWRLWVSGNLACSMRVSLIKSAIELCLVICKDGIVQSFLTATIYNWRYG